MAASIQRHHFRRLAAIGAVVLALWFVLGSALSWQQTRPVRVGGASGAPDGLRLTLCSGQNSSTDPMVVRGMLPGDSVTQRYCLRVYHKKDVTLQFSLRNLRDTDSLGEKLCLRVQQQDGPTLWDGPLRELTSVGVRLTLPADSRRYTDVWYIITAYLPTDTGNDYQNIDTALMVDFEWQAEETEALTGPSGSGMVPLPAVPHLPQTEDALHLMALLAALAGSGVLLLLLLHRRSTGRAQVGADAPQQDDQQMKTLLRSLLIAAALTWLLVLTTYAMTLADLRLPNNQFQTGTVQISLQKGEIRPISLADQRMEPGKTLTQTFTVTNTGTAEIYCRLYLSRAQGGLLDDVQFAVFADDVPIFEGSAARLTDRTACSLPDTLDPGETCGLRVQILMPTAAGNAAQADWLEYDLTVDATQTLHNPQKSYS